MKISFNWLKKYISTNLSLKKICNILTDIGLEVESLKKHIFFPKKNKNIIVGKFVCYFPHPNQKKLKIIILDVGLHNYLNFVIKKSNFFKKKVLVAINGAILFNKKGKKIKIKKKYIYNILSEGIIITWFNIGFKEKEIILLESTVPIGINVKKLSSNILEDNILEISITPNRSDAMSHYGIARDLHIALKARGYKSNLISPPIFNNINKQSNFKKIKVFIKNKKKCLRYSGLILSNIKIDFSPFWIQKKLKSIGLNPINNIIDIINFVIHEFGQPIQIFDLDKIKNKKIKIKNTNNFIPFKGSDGILRYLGLQDLIIFNYKFPIALAGILNNINFSITRKTKNIFLESSFYNPIIIRNCTKKHNINNDSSFRFERGIDPNNIIYILKRIIFFIKKILFFNFYLKYIDFYPKKIKHNKIIFSYKRMNIFIGKKISYKKIKNILSILEIKILSEKKKKLKILVPFYRIDVKREIDVFEEILRIYGYNNIKISNIMNFSIKNHIIINNNKIKNIISEQLVNNGFYEVINNSILKNNYLIFLKKKKIIKIINKSTPEFSILRPTLLFGMMENIKYNINKKNLNLKFFEWGKIFFKKKKKILEKNYLSIILINNKLKYNFFYLKGIIIQIIKKFGIINSIEEIIKNNNSFFEKKIIIKYKKKKIIELGNIKNNILNFFKIKKNIFFSEINYKFLLKIIKNNKIFYKNFSKYPIITRDISLIINDNILYKEIYKLIRYIENKYIKKIQLIDTYKGIQIPKKKKSYTIRLYIEEKNKILTENIIYNLQKIFKKKFNAKIR
jgi:phenylalanyl-tRNA synthetase beta chain